MVFVPAFREERRRGNLKGQSAEPGREVIESCPRRRMMSLSTRRDFLAATFGAAALSRLGAQPAKRLATDWVTLGKSNVKVTRLALGTGTFGGRVQRELGQEGFTSLVRHAYDRGIRFFETAEGYRGMAEMLGMALKGLPRESYTLMTKYSTPGSGVNPGPKIDDFRRQLQTEYIDILLLHCLRPPTWETDYRSLQNGLSEAKSKKVIHSHGASVHGLPALRTRSEEHTSELQSRQYLVCR